MTAIARAQRASVAAQNRAVRERARVERERARAVRQHQRAQAAYNRDMEREAKRQYLQDQFETAEDQTAELAGTVAALDVVLSQAMDVDDRIDFDSLRLPTTYPPFEAPPNLVRGRPEPQHETYVSSVRPPGFFSRVIPGAEARYQLKLSLAEAQYESAVSEHQFVERTRMGALNAAHQQYEAQKAEALAEAKQRNTEVDAFESSYLSGDVGSIVAYNAMVLERSEYPVDMPQAFRLEYEPESREIVIDYELPRATIIPATAEVRYVKSKDTFDEKPRRASEIRERHKKLVASIALRSVHEVFEADQANHVDCVTFSGFVHAVDPATGQDGRPYLVSIRASREEFKAIDLARVDPIACLQKFALGLRSQVKATASQRTGGTNQV